MSTLSCYTLCRPSFPVKSNFAPFPPLMKIFLGLEKSSILRLFLDIHQFSFSIGVLFIEFTLLNKNLHFDFESVGIRFVFTSFLTRPPKVIDFIVLVNQSISSLCDWVYSDAPEIEYAAMPLLQPPIYPSPSLATGCIPMHLK